jgi:hypothetical protein
MDKDGDGKITMGELQQIGLDGLPNFEDLGAEGHHYDVESGTCSDIYTCTKGEKKLNSRCRVLLAS